MNDALLSRVMGSARALEREAARLRASPAPQVKAAPGGSGAGGRGFPQTRLGPGETRNVNPQTPPEGFNDVGRAINADRAIRTFGVDGSGMKIGILADSFNAHGGAPAAEAGGALPGAKDVKVLRDDPGGEDEGQAMAEIVHKVAPKAQIYFYATPTGAGPDAVAAGIKALQAQGVKVIAEDRYYFSEPFFRVDSPVDKAIDAFVKSGGRYFTQAGNSGSHSFYEDEWKPTAATLPGIGAVKAMNFGSTAHPKAFETVRLHAGIATFFDLQWKQKWKSLDGVGTKYSLGFALYDPQGHLVFNANDNATGGDPYKWYSVKPEVTGEYKLAIYWNGGTPPAGTFKIIASNQDNRDVEFEHTMGSGAIFGHALDPNAVTVGASNYLDSPAYGRQPQNEAFSSKGAGPGHGPGHAGPKPDLTGPDAGKTTVPDFPDFFGTSAATPAVAAVAALMEEANPDLTPAETKAILERTALRFGQSDVAGAGLVDAFKAIAQAEAERTAAR